MKTLDFNEMENVNGGMVKKDLIFGGLAIGAIIGAGTLDPLAVLSFGLAWADDECWHY